MSRYRCAFVIVDLEGTASAMASYAISRADAAECAKAIKLGRSQEKAFGRAIPLAVLLTRIHSTITTTMRYAHSNHETKARAVARLLKCAKLCQSCPAAEKGQNCSVRLFVIR